MLAEKEVFSRSMKVLVFVSLCSEEGRLFQALFRANENERSPDFRHMHSRLYR